MQLYELSHAQKRILLSQQMYPNKPVCNIGGYAIFDGYVKIENLKTALIRTVEFYDAFSIRIRLTSEGYRQYFLWQEPEPSLWESNKTTIDSEQTVISLVREMLEKPFPLLDEALFRIMLLRLGKDRVGYAICCHHIIFDGWSMRLFTDAVNTFYNGSIPQKSSYVDYLKQEQQYLESSQAERDRMFWEQMLEKFKPDKIEGSSACYGWREEFLMTESLGQRFTEIGDRFGGINMILHAFVGLMEVYRRNNQPALLSIPIYSRRGKRMKSTVGMFTSTMLLGIPCEAEWTLSEFVEEIKNRFRKSLRHQRWPYNLIKNREHAQFRCSVNCYNMNLHASMGTASGKYREIYPGCQAIPVQIILNTWEKPWRIVFDLRSDLFRKEDSKVMMLFFENFLTVLEKDPECTVMDFVHKLEEQERSRQKGTFLEDLQVFSLTKQFQKIFEIENSEEVVIYYDEKNINKEQLSNYLCSAAKSLTDAGLQCGDKIVLLMENSPEYVIYTLAAVGLGIIFIPLDIDTLEEQISFVLSNSAAAAIVTKMNLSINFQKKVIRPLLSQDTQFFQWPELSDTEIVYCIYTSGTTGKSKGVTVSRGALASYLSWSRTYYSCSEKKLNFLMFTSPAFDLSLTALFLPLTSDGQLVIVPRGGIHQLHNLQNISQVTAIKATPSHLELLLRTDKSNLSLKAIICGGEELTVSLAKRLQQRFGVDCQIYNEYGPTECTIGCMYHKFNSLDGEDRGVSIGRAAPGCRAYVVSENKHLAYGGTIGEIYLAGKQLATGYLNEPKKTREAFLQNFLGETVTYRTGDLARYENGKLTYLGRKDNQKKINGYRIELGGVENAIKSIPGVTNAGVWVEPGVRQTLCAAVETTILAEKFIRTELLKMLPVYCMPHHFFLREQLPLNQNGKLDTSLFQIQTKSPQGTVRKVVESAIRKVLDYNGDIDKFDYFAAGGDSVRALFLSTALEEAGLSLSMADILTHPKIKELEALVIDTKMQQTQTLEEYPLPKHLQYLRDTCTDFRKYRHTLVFCLNNELSQKWADESYHLLLKKFPALQTEFEYEKGVLRYNRNHIGSAIHAKRGEMRKKLEMHSDHLFNFVIEYDLAETKIGISLHHILADAVSWKLILGAMLLLTEGKDIQQIGDMRLYQLDEAMEYNWPNQVPLCLGEYFTCSATIPLTEPCDIYTFIDLCTETLAKRTETANMVALCDWNGRMMLKQTGMTTEIGCYSVFLPIYPKKGMVRSQIEELLNQKKIDLPAQEKAIRINFLGDLGRLMPSKLKFVPESLEWSMESCSAHGCAAEITCVCSATEMKIYIATRGILDLKLLPHILEDVVKRVENPIREDLLGLNKSEIDALFDD
ncbi:MAG: AMP-binding protein [Christensenellaceae bacterium]|nr:AMP-binding protein [Christensenellaceae bacterium]